MRLEGKTALITGAGSGMGRVAAVLFAKEGAKVAAWDVADATPFVDELKSAGAPDAFAAKVNVADAASVAEAVAEVIATLMRDEERTLDGQNIIVRQQI